MQQKFKNFRKKNLLKQQIKEIKKLEHVVNLLLEYIKNDENKPIEKLFNKMEIENRTSQMSEVTKELENHNLQQKKKINESTKVN